MEILTKKATILFSPKIYNQLAHLAHQQKTSVAHLVRQAAIQYYLVPDRRTRLEAVEALTKMELPVADWSKMEQEITGGVLKQS